MTTAPEPITRVAELMADFPVAWCLCGGWAIDAWLGRQTRDHQDVDVAVFHDDQRAVFEHLRGWTLVGHDHSVPGNTSEPWNGRQLGLPAHIHASAPRSDQLLPERLDDPAGLGFGLEIVLNQRAGGTWVMSDEPWVSLPVVRCVRRSSWGVPTAVPEVVLFYKATAYFDDETLLSRNPKDEADFLALLPVLKEKQRAWLRDAISCVRPGHPWVAHLE